MKQSFNLLSFFLLSCVFYLLPHSAYSEPLNLERAEIKVKKYYNTGLYQQELKAKILEAQYYLEEEAKISRQSNSHKKLALVLDVDETSLSNYDNMVKRHFQGSYEQIHQEILAADAPAIEPMLDLYNSALKHGIHVFFVTGRYDNEELATKKNLLRAGYKNWSGLFCRPKGYAEKSIIPFKSQTRANLEKQGYIILAAIGDQDSDLRGGHKKKGFKLPNPFYFLP